LATSISPRVGSLASSTSEVRHPASSLNTRLLMSMTSLRQSGTTTRQIQPLTGTTGSFRKGTHHCRPDTSPNYQNRGVLIPEDELYSQGVLTSGGGQNWKAFHYMGPPVLPARW
jgi:hypothetical protein